MLIQNNDSVDLFFLPWQDLCHMGQERFSLSKGKSGEWMGDGQVKGR